MGDGAVDQRKKLLLNLISDVKSRLDGKVDHVTFPIPQFIVIGKQSVGKSRLIEGLAGEPFNFVSGTLGSRRPTILELRNVPGLIPSRWSVFDENTMSWNTYPVAQVMQIVGKAHEMLGTSVSDVPIKVKVEGADTVDLGLVDLPGFRAYAKDDHMKVLSDQIHRLVDKFMRDENNVMLCVEEAGDNAGFATLMKCRQVDSSYRRTVLIRNKLDKYYSDLTAENVNRWLEGFGDLPNQLIRFAVSLPHWNGPAPPKPFGEMRNESAEMDCKTLQNKGASQKYAGTIGFNNFRYYMEIRTQQMFADALNPLLMQLKAMRGEHQDRLNAIEQEMETINEDNILQATRAAGICFAQSFKYLMEGALSSETNRKTMQEELLAFHEYVRRTDVLKPEAVMTTSFDDLTSYIEYLRTGVKLPGMDVQLNGGAQFKRLMYEVEVFARFANVAQSVKQQELIQVRGDSTPWEAVIRKLIQSEKPKVMKEKTGYVGERIKWFFMEQKECVLQFMLGIKGSPEEHMYAERLYLQAQVIKRNDTMKACIFKTFDETCERLQKAFKRMWDDWMDSMFQSPLTLLKAGTAPKIDDSYYTEKAPTLDVTKGRIKEERERRGRIGFGLMAKIKRIPDSYDQSDVAMKMVQEIIEETSSVIRCVVADQMELYAKSFFLLPMLRRLEGDMANLELEEEDKERYRARHTVLLEEQTKSTGILKDLDWCIDAIQKFRITWGGGE